LLPRRGEEKGAKERTEADSAIGLVTFRTKRNTYKEKETSYVAAQAVMGVRQAGIKVTEKDSNPKEPAGMVRKIKRDGRKKTGETRTKRERYLKKWEMGRGKT